MTVLLRTSRLTRQPFVTTRRHGTDNPCKPWGPCMMPMTRTICVRSRLSAYTGLQGLGVTAAFWVTPATRSPSEFPICVRHRGIPYMYSAHAYTAARVKGQTRGYFHRHSKILLLNIQITFAHPESGSKSCYGSWWCTFQARCCGRCVRHLGCLHPHRNGKGLGTRVGASRSPLSWTAPLWKSGG